MKRYLVVANQTLGGAELLDAIQERASAERVSFYVCVPDTAARDQASLAPGALGAGAGGQAGSVFIAPIDPHVSEEPGHATRVARQRLEEMLRMVTEAGADVGGEIGPPDPYEAIKQELADRQFDEILLSTLPSSMSRWLSMDLPSRVRRLFDGPVTVIEASA
jgi:hypothetical protein